MRISILAVIAFAFFSCNKQDTVNNQANCINKSQQVRPISGIARQTLSASNPANPYDNVGVEHNEVVDELLGIMRSDNSHSLTSIKLNLEIINKEKYGTDIIIDTPELAQEIPDCCVYADSVVNVELQHLLSIVDNAGNYGDYYSYKAAIISLENYYLNSNYLTVDQKLDLLSSSSIARYSGAYWWHMKDDNTLPPNSHKGVIKDDVKAWQSHNAAYSAGYSVGSALRHFSEWLFS